MSSSRPNFSAFPFERLPRLSREHAAIESAIARHAAARRTGTRVAKLLGGPLRLTRTQLVQPSVDPHAALAEVRVGAVAIAVAASGGIRAITQRILGGVDELPGPRPATSPSTRSSRSCSRPRSKTLGSPVRCGRSPSTRERSTSASSPTWRGARGSRSISAV